MIDVAAAIIANEQGQLLIARRGADKPQPGLWEFPGGKLEEGESPEECLVRELREEMGIEILPFARYGIHEHRYEHASIRLIACRCKLVSGEIRLTDHDDYRWASPEELAWFNWAPADVPFVQRLIR